MSVKQKVDVDKTIAHYVSASNPPLEQTAASSDMCTPSSALHVLDIVISRRRSSAEG